MQRRSWIRTFAAAALLATATTTSLHTTAAAAPFDWQRWAPVFQTQAPTQSAPRTSAPQPAPQAAPATATQAAQTATQAAQTDTATRIFELTNEERRKAGVAPLARNSCLDDSAQRWSDRMSAERKMYHSDLYSWMRACNLSRVGENVAYGGRTAEQTVRMWMDSPGHRDNILDPRFTQLGVGWAENGSYATQHFGG